MRRTFLVTLGWVLVVFGAIFTPMPPPFAFGGIMLVTGLSILTANSKTVRRWVQTTRHRFRNFSVLVEKIDGILPSFVSGIGKRTAPEPLSRLQRLKQTRDTRQNQLQTKN